MNWLDRAVVVSPYYTLCLTERTYRQALRHLKVPKKNWQPFVTPKKNATVHAYYCGPKLCSIVCMKDYEGKDPITIAGLLVHEAVHIWQHMCDAMNESAPSIEFEAWSIQWIAQQLMWSFVEQTK